MWSISIWYIQKGNTDMEDVPFLIPIIGEMDFFFLSIINLLFNCYVGFKRQQ